MHLIVTHEQSDFDAIASLVGACLLDPQALAVMPRRINRNVRAYLTLYGDDLPLVAFSDLPRRRIARLTLVDTQSMPSLKGLGRNTQVHVVDHHPLDRELDPAWTVHVEEVGATATLIVEAMQEAQTELDVVSATLLLLGIYEDTGSLSYGGTTPRDVRACAWLLERGASIAVVADFLDHPLSTDQQDLYERLLEAVEAHEFHGMSVVIASAKAEGMADEISTLAHKLRDVFDPVGLFVLVALNGNVQMVARSTSDALNVGLIAEHFGGGGHERAAAALIRGKELEEIRSQLLKLLPESIQPPVTVSEIMSRGPQLLEPKTTISEAAERMQRFGHEGYPVVEQGRVIGLLTRRAVDRAMSHGMGDRAVSSVMKAGHLVAHPSDSVQTLQRLMIEHDWGQVPVADPESNAIVGIVTRTDLLKTLAPAETNAAKPDLVQELERALPRARLALLKLVAEQAEIHGDALYIVGGFVRDLLLGSPSVDFDLVVEGKAIILARELARRYGGRISSHGRFGTAKWRLSRQQPELIQALGEEDTDDLPASLDFVTARTEFYTHPTALPSVRSSSIKLDLHRRDFTLNTLALRLDGAHYGQLLDHWGGGQDLRQGLIRALHSLSFVDDPTRALRAVRLEQRLGFSIESRTLELLTQALPLLERVSGERIRSELKLMFVEARLPLIMARLQELGLLAAIHPELRWDDEMGKRFEEVQVFSAPEAWRLTEQPEREILFHAILVFALPLETARQVCARLNFPSNMRSAILQANTIGSQLLPLAGKAVPSQILSMLEGMPEASLASAWLATADQPEVRKVIDLYLREWRFIEPRTDGNDLRALGLEPGPAFARILWSLRAAWLDGELKSAKDEKRLLKQLADEVLEQD
jgi:tRNA nucleotidyltransferase (CCA-adding enzyme)